MPQTEGNLLNTEGASGSELEVLLPVHTQQNEFAWLCIFNYVLIILFSVLYVFIYTQVL